MNDFGLMTKTGKQLALRGVDVNTRITGTLAETSLVQRYQNSQSTNVELSYTFPLPVAAVLLSFGVAVGTRRFEGEVVRRSQAEVAYEEAIGEGNSAFRVQEIRPGMFCASLGNVMAGESVDITLVYVESLAWNGHALRYRLPTTIAPRFGTPSGMEPWQRPETDVSVEYALNLRVSLSEALAQSAITCPSHSVSLQATPDGLTVSLARRASLDRDFILEIENDAVTSLGVSASARDTHLAMLTLLAPTVPGYHARDVVLVIDCSGSMQGDSLMMAKEGVLLALGSLEPNERFGIVAFGSSFQIFDPALQPANRKNLDMARRWVNYLENLGGTDIEGALTRALSLYDGKPMDILLLTDGQDWRAGRAIPEANAKGIRIFPMGIGSAVAEEALQKLASETAGACELITPTEDMSARIHRHFNRMRQPEMKRLEITWPSPPLWEARPQGACFAGDAYTVFAAFPAAVEQSAQVMFSFGDAGSRELEVPLTVDTIAADGIIRLGAQQRLSSLAASEQADWAVQYQLISSWTDYLVTMQREANEQATALPNLQIQPQMLPAGWGGTSTVERSSSRMMFSVQATAQATGLHDAVAFSERAADYSQFDVPSVIRRPASAKRSDTLLSIMHPNGNPDFIVKLTAQCKGREGKLPSTVDALRQLLLPETLQTFVDEAVQRGIDDDEVILAFFAALLRHDGKAKLSHLLTRKLVLAVGNRAPEETLCQGFVTRLNELKHERDRGGDRFDIPSFLRRMID